MTLELSPKKLSIAEALIIIGFSLFPLFFNYPYRVNIFLSWEGAYRMSLGQVPYRDFGLPMGFAYWIIPAFFFKLFGPTMFSLVKAQVLINLISGFTFRGVLRVFDMDGGKRLLTVILYCLSYSFFNFWPWYNHSVFVFELIGLYFLLRGVYAERAGRSYLFIVLAAFFTFISFFTKQDGGALALLLSLALLVYQAIANKKLKQAIVFAGAYAAITIIVFAAFAPHNIGYWFNYGQPPHYSRVSLRDLLDEIIGSSMWLKFYLTLVLLIAIIKTQGLTTIRSFFFDSKSFTFFLLTCGILVQALIVQVTSYTPPDNNIYFHSFAFAYLLFNVQFPFSSNKIPSLAIGTLLIFFWWSGVYYKYVQRVLDRILPQKEVSENRNVVSKNTYMVNTDSTSMDVEMSEWRLSGLKSFSGVYMPESTIEGMKRLLERPEIKGKSKPKVLNMSELTPLANEIGYELEVNQPLWYHLNVSMFDKEVELFCNKISNQYYDVVLFEDVPNLNNFYPYAVQDCLREHYQLADEFLAPRRPTNAVIEVYVRKSN